MRTLTLPVVPSSHGTVESGDSVLKSDYKVFIANDDSPTSPYSIF